MLGLLSYVLMMGGPIAALPPAEKLSISATLQAGSGLSMAGEGGTTYARRSPAYLQLDIGFIHPQLRWLEFAPAVMLELEGRVSIGVMPKLRAFVPFSGKVGQRILAYGMVGVPVIVAPFTMAGVQAGLGLGVQLHEHFAVVAEGTGAGYFLGSDLMEGTALGKLDVQGGLRVRF